MRKHGQLDVRETELLLQVTLPIGIASGQRVQTSSVWRQHQPALLDCLAALLFRAPPALPFPFGCLLAGWCPLPLAIERRRAVADESIHHVLRQK
eukprot:scaffold382_cov380-Prasinococcus_capsulatus_cf.AAC.13